MKISAFYWVCLLVCSFIMQAAGGKNPANRNPLIVGDVVVMDTNNVELPLNNDGSNGENGQGHYPAGSGLTFLFQGGLGTTAFINGELRASWMAKSSLIQEWQPGTWGMDPDDPSARFYVVTAKDGPGSPAFLDWADAVALGAEFIDLDGDGLYDPNIDHPPLVGDKMAWTVYNDGTPLSERSLGTPPIELKIQQTVWAYDQGELADAIFFRIQLLNPTPQAADDVIYSVWDDADIGDFQDDLVGCDTVLNVGYIYNDGSDAIYGNNPPAFGIKLLQGALVDSPGDTAVVYRGPVQGVDTLFDKRTLPMTSFMQYINADPILGDPQNASHARNYQVGGLTRDGSPINPTQWGVGGTPQTNPRYFYSGDPVTGTGWIDNQPVDKRSLVNSGPFNLAPGDTQDIVFAYVVAQGTDALNSITEMKQRASFLDVFFPYGRLLEIVVNDSLISTDSTFVFDVNFFSLVSGETLQTVQWQLIDQPPGSNSQLIPGGGFQVLLEPDMAGDYTVRAEGMLQNGSPVEDTLTVTAITNHPPSAQLTIQPSTITFGDAALADASASIDPDGDVLTYQWDLPDWVIGLFPDTANVVSFTPVHTGSDEVRVTVSDQYFAVQASDSFQVVPRMSNLTQQVYLPDLTSIAQLEDANGKIFAIEHREFGNSFQLSIFNAGINPGTPVTNTVSGSRFRTNGLVLVNYGKMAHSDLYTVDDSSNLTLASTLPKVLEFNGHTADVAFENSLLYLPTSIPWRLHIFDISDPTAPVELNGIPLPSLTNDMAFAGNLAAAYSRHPTAGLVIYDLTTLTPLDTLALPPMDRDIAFGGSNIYVLNGLLEGDEVQIVDASQPNNLQLAGTISVSSVIPGFFSNPILSMAANGNVLLLGLKDGIRVYDCSDPNNPQEIACRHSGLEVRGMAWNDPQLYLVENGDTSFGAGYYCFDYMVGIKTPEIQIPTAYQLFQNYPNPFNPETIIRYQLPAATDVELVIYNLLGQRVKTLVNQRQARGTYSIQWDSTNEGGQRVSSGVYLYRLKAGNFSQVRKMLLLR